MLQVVSISTCPLCDENKRDVPRASWKCLNCGSDNLALYDKHNGQEQTCAECNNTFRSKDADYLCPKCRS